MSCLLSSLVHSEGDQEESWNSAQDDWENKTILIPKLRVYLETN